MNNLTARRFLNICKVMSIFIFSICLIFNFKFNAYAKEDNEIQVIAYEVSGDDGNVASNAFDRAYETRWSSNGVGEYLILDLGEEVEVSYFGISFFKGSERSSNFEIFVSNNGEKYEQVFTGTSSGSSTELELFDISDTKARYIKFVFNGNSANTWNSVTELTVYSPTTGEMTLSKIEALEAEVRKDITYTEAGFINHDLSKHYAHKANVVTGKTINITDYKVDLLDNANNDLEAIRKAISDAKFGDEIYFPDGVYNLTSTGNYYLLLKSGVNLRGESKDGTIFIAQSNETTYPDAIFKSMGQNDLLISNITITSDFKGEFYTDHNANNDVLSPKYGIQIEDDALTIPSYNITIDNVVIEKFRTQGIRISKSHDIIVKNSTFKNATDVGAGGAGYGVTIQGEGFEIDRLGYKNDSRHNLVENCVFEGPYLRHGVLIQYYSHNNLVRNNYFDSIILDAVDLHGEDEYLNEITQNTMKNIVTGAGVGVGNSGATHDKSGSGNYIHNNTIENSREGVKVYFGTDGTVIENNTITNSSVQNSKGIYLLGAPNTILKNNIISGNNADGFVGIYLGKEALENEIGDASGSELTGNVITGNTTGLLIESGFNISVIDNIIKDNNEDIIDKRTDDDKVIVSNSIELKNALTFVKPGDTIYLKNGTWKDEQLVINVSGTKDEPITIMAETKGEVILTGNSTLRIGGDYLVVDGLYFKDGALDGSSGGIIEFREGPEGKVANNSILRNTAIADYNSDNKETDYKWVSLYGTYNTVENSDFRGKDHRGALLVIWRSDDSAQYHTVRYNKFSYIQDFGDNGAEVIRVGTSQESLSDSFTTVEYNIFEQCNGEVEIISNKSGNNTYRGNLFIDSAGTLTLRHGNNALVEENFFFGGNYYGTGGIRIIGENHTVINNYIENIKGDGGSFKSAINVTNGVLDSPLNRYFQVKNAYIANNVLINNEANIYLGSGKSEELSLPPINMTLKDNTIVDPLDEVIRYYDDPIDSIYENNETVNYGDLEYVKEYGIYVPYGFSARPVDTDLVGPTWVLEDTFVKRNLYEEATQVKVNVPFEYEEDTVLVGIESDEAYVGNTKKFIDLTDKKVVPFVLNDTAYIPLVFIFEQYGFDVSYNNSDGTIIAKNKDTLIKFDVAKNVYSINSGDNISSEIVITNNRSYISLGNLEDILNVNSIFDTRGIVIISKTENIINQFKDEKLLYGIVSIYRVKASNNDGNVPLNTIDNDISTRWSSEGDNEWIKYDLFETKNINEVKIAFFKGNERFTMFDIEVSLDDIDYQSVYSGQSSGEINDFESFVFENIDARYVKIMTKGNSKNKWNSINDLKIITSTGEEAFEPVTLKFDVVIEDEVDTDNTDNADKEEIIVADTAIKILPTDDAYVEMAKADENFGDADRLRTKANESGSVNRISYLKYDLSEFESITEAFFQISSKMSANNEPGTELTFDIYSVTNKDWSEKDITWETAFNISEDGKDITGIGSEVMLINTVTMSDLDEVKTYTVDFTEYLSNYDADFITIMIVDTTKQNGNVDFYSKERSSEELRPYLYIVK